VLGGLYGLFLLVLVLFALGGLSRVDLTVRTEWLAIFGVLIVLGWTVLPLLIMGVDQTLEPERFATLAVPQRSLTLGLFAASLISPGGILMIILGVGWGLATSSSLGGFLAGAFGGLLGASLCVLLSRWSTSAFAGLMKTRRVREIAMGILFLGLILIGPVMAGGGALLSQEGLRRQLALVASYTPLGAPWLLGTDAEAGAGGAFALHLAITLGGIILLFLLWSRALAQELVDVGGRSGGRRSSAKALKGTGLIGAFGSSPTLLMASRSLLYWLKDPRYVMSLILVPVIIGFSAVQYMAVGFGMVVFFGMFLAFLLGWTLSYDTSMDSTALWTHIAAGVDGRAERAARVVSYAVVGVLTVLIQSVVVLLLTGSGLNAAVTGLLALGTWAVAAGAGVFVTSMTVQPTTKPHDNVFNTRQGGFLAIAIQFAGMAGVGLLMLPGVLMAMNGLGQGQMGMVWGGLVYAAVLGALVLFLGVWFGGRQFDQRQVALLEKLVRLDLG
jgi:ABC-2 type transport system permease protein